MKLKSPHPESSTKLGPVEVDLNGPNDTILVRGQVATDGPALSFNHAEWEAFLAGCKAGEFDFGGV